MSTERDSHFQGFARASWQDVRNKVSFVADTDEEYFDERVIEILAQHAYDLLYHFVVHSDEGYHNAQAAMNAVLPHIPDLTQLPDPSPDE